MTATSSGLALTSFVNQEDEMQRMPVLLSDVPPACILPVF
jgi:hypothetical protein